MQDIKLLSSLAHPVLFVSKCHYIWLVVCSFLGLSCTHDCYGSCTVLTAPSHRILHLKTWRGGMALVGTISRWPRARARLCRWGTGRQIPGGGARHPRNHRPDHAPSCWTGQKNQFHAHPVLRLIELANEDKQYKSQPVKSLAAFIIWNIVISKNVL